jgi:biopolymer transport protein ExbB/TolQ
MAPKDLLSTTEAIHLPRRRWIKGGLVKPFFYGGIMTTLIVYAVLMVLRPQGIGPFFLGRGLVQPIILATAFTVLCFSLLRINSTRSERLSINKNWMLDPKDFAEEKDLALLESSKLLSQSKSLVANRQSRVLFAFILSKSNNTAREVHQDDSYSTSSDIDHAYLLVRALVWSMPMLGFLGTVLGISNAVGGFSGLLGNVNDIDSVKLGLGSVTTGLSTAFDTTVLGIICAIACMSIVTLSEKSELQLATMIDDKVTDTILSRLV